MQNTNNQVVVEKDSPLPIHTCMNLTGTTYHIYDGELRHLVIHYQLFFIQSGHLNGAFHNSLSSMEC